MHNKSQKTSCRYDNRWFFLCKLWKDERTQQHRISCPSVVWRTMTLNLGSWNHWCSKVQQVFRSGNGPPFFWGGNLEKRGFLEESISKIQWLWKEFWFSSMYILEFPEICHPMLPKHPASMLKRKRNHPMLVTLWETGHWYWQMIHIKGKMHGSC